MYHYAALPGRTPLAEGWHQIDRLTFELNIAYPMYVSGELAPDEVHPLMWTDQALEWTRAWYRAHVPGPYYWEED